MKNINVNEKYINAIVNAIIIFILSFLYTISIMGSKSSIFNFFIIFAIVFFIIYLIWNKLDKIKLIDNSKNKVISKKEFILYSILIVIPMIIAILAYYPAFCTPDSYTQWDQVQSGEYSNWHPVMETLFMLKLPSLFYNNMISATIFQCAIIFLILMYFCYFCRKNFLSFKQTVIVLLLIVMNPIFMKYSVTLWKDVMFSWCIFLGTLCLINISITDGEWIKKINNKFLFIFASFGILFFRHNGLVPFILMNIALILFYTKKTKFFMISFITILICYFIIIGPIYKIFNIDNKTGGKPEMMGVIMGQIAYYYKNQAYFSESELEFLNGVVPLEAIDKYYIPGNFNYIKWSIKNYNENVNENFMEIMKLYINKSFHNPGMFFNSFLIMSEPIWKTTYNLTEIDYKYRDETKDSGKIGTISNDAYTKLVDYNVNVNNSFIRWLFINIGQGLFLIIFGIFMMVKNHNKLKKYLPFILALSNSLIMMCLITGYEYRFVYYQTLVPIPLLIYSFFINIKDKVKK